MPLPAIRAFAELVGELYTNEIAALATPPPAPERINSFDGEKYRAALRERVARLHDPMVCLDEMHVTFTSAASILHLRSAAPDQAAEL